MARAIWHARRTIYAEATSRSCSLWHGPSGMPGAAADAALAVSVAVAAYRAAQTAGDLLPAQGVIRNVLSWYNHSVRLAVRDQERWPRTELSALARSHAQARDETFGRRGALAESPEAQVQEEERLLKPLQILPPQTPCEYVEESLAWWGFGKYDRVQDWLGHGYFWRGLACAEGDEEIPGQILENAAGNAANDYDVLEDRFRRLRRARVLCADRTLLRQNFPGALHSCDDAAVDTWLLHQAAWISEGQVERLRPQGDHFDLLGIGENLDSFVDEASARAGIRIRSGGRAATFFVGDRYVIREDGGLCADMIEVKGLGTHVAADISSPRVTGLLGLADALRELCFQRLLQRLVELEGLEDSLGTVPCYALIDTGLRYQGTNPATGWDGESCALLLRQPQSRLFDAYDGMNFSGICPDAVHNQGPGRALRALLHKWGVSAEFEPRALCYRLHDVAGDGVEDCAALLEDQTGIWNLQADAPCTHFMDFSDYYVLPQALLPRAWRMSEEALRRAFTLERAQCSDRALACPALAERLWGSTDPQVAAQARSAAREELSAEPALREAAAMFEDSGRIKPLKPKYCMCWFMELDDSEVAQWCTRTAKEFQAADPDNVAPSRDILAEIEAWLPLHALQPPVQDE